MVKTVIFIVGLPGSGKTELGTKLIEEKEDSVFFDEVLENKENEAITKACQEYNTVIISSPYLCLAEIRDEAVKFVKDINSKVKIKWHFFDYDVMSCITNRPDMKHRIFTVASHYSIPPRVKRIKVELKNDTEGTQSTP
jgi:hypothetical protein